MCSFWYSSGQNEYFSNNIVESQCLSYPFDVDRDWDICFTLSFDDPFLSSAAMQSDMDGKYAVLFYYYNNVIMINWCSVQ